MAKIYDEKVSVASGANSMKTSNKSGNKMTAKKQPAGNSSAGNSNRSMLINVVYTKVFTGSKEQTFRCVLFYSKKWFCNYSFNRLVIARDCLTIRLSSPCPL